MKYYFFRDTDNDSNLLDGRTYHAAGYVYSVNCELDNPTKSGKDLAVTFLEPFGCDIVNAWRSLDEVELFEVDEWEYKQAVERYSNIHL